MPAVLTEKIVSLFNFYLNGKIQQGMRYGFDLYQLAFEFQPNDRLKAYQHANELMQDGLQVVVTAATNRYVVWVSLRSPLSEQNSAPVQSEFPANWERLAV